MHKKLLFHLGVPIVFLLTNAGRKKLFWNKIVIFMVENSLDTNI